MNKPENIVLEGVAGSKAFGLATEDSDTDLRGVYMAPLQDVLGLQSGQVVSKTYTHTNPDVALHEIGKFISLALRGNPTVLETLWLPNHHIKTEVGDFLVENRSRFLSKKTVYTSYAGYADSQANRLSNKPITEKSGRHAVRLLIQGTELLKTGELNVDCSARRGEIFGWGKEAVNNPEEFRKTFDYLRLQLKFAHDNTCLPIEPDRGFWERALPRLRMLGG